MGPELETTLAPRLELVRERCPESLLIAADAGKLTTPSKQARKASAISLADENRSSGSRAHALANHASSAAGRFAFASVGGFGLPVAIITASAPNDGPS